MKGSFALALGALLLLGGCGAGEAPVFGEEDLALTVGGVVFDCETDIEAVTAALGDGYEYAEGRSCAYDGLDKTYQYPEAIFYTNPLAEGDIVTEIYTESPEVSTTKGVGVGSTREEVETAYGEPDEDDGYTLYYRVSDEAGEPALCFDLTGDTVSALFLTRGLI